MVMFIKHVQKVAKAILALNLPSPVCPFSAFGENPGMGESYIPSVINRPHRAQLTPKV